MYCFNNDLRASALSRTHRYIKLIVSSGIMLQKNIYPTIAANLGIGLEDAHVRFSRNYSIEKIIAILRGILDNNNISYYAGTIETSAYRPSDTEMIGQK